MSTYTIYIYIHIYIYIYTYIHTHTHLSYLPAQRPSRRPKLQRLDVTPGLHNKIPAHKIFARVWVAQESIFYTINAKIFQGLGPKRQESCHGDRVYAGMLRSRAAIATLHRNSALLR